MLYLFLCFVCLSCLQLNSVPRFGLSPNSVGSFLPFVCACLANAGMLLMFHRLARLGSPCLLFCCAILLLVYFVFAYYIYIVCLPLCLIFIKWNIKKRFPEAKKSANVLWFVKKCLPLHPLSGNNPWWAARERVLWQVETDRGYVEQYKARAGAEHLACPVYGTDPSGFTSVEVLR